MQRRDFVKSAMCLSCLGLMNSGCSDLLSLQNDEFKDFEHTKSRFYYKSVDELPKTIRLEACSLCQLNCPACTVRKLEKNAPKDWLGYLKFSDFKKFIDKHPFIKEIELSNNGEIFLNPELDDIIKYAYEKKIRLTALNGVNFNTVNDKILETLVKCKFRNLTIALDGATAETYKIYRRGGDFNTVIKNIEKLNQLKEKYSSKFPKLIYQFIVFGHNEHEIEDAKKLAKKLKMEIKFRKNTYDESYSPIKNQTSLEQSTELKFKQEDKNYLACKKMFSNVQIDYNGNLLGCCFIQLSHFRANAFKEGLLNALNSPDFIWAKHMLSDFSYKPKKGVPCSICVNYHYIKENNFPLS